MVFRSWTGMDGADESNNSGGPHLPLLFSLNLSPEPTPVQSGGPQLPLLFSLNLDPEQTYGSGQWAAGGLLLGLSMNLRGTYVPDTQAPTASTLTATATSPTEISLSWTASTDNVGVAGYTLQRSDDNVSWATVYAGLNRAYNDTALPADTTYFYRVRAEDAAGNASQWDTSSATTFTVGATPGFPRVGYYWIGSASLGGFLAQYGTDTGLNLMAASDIVVINGWENVHGGRSGTYKHHQAFIAEAKSRSSKDTKVVMYFDSEALLPQSSAPAQIAAASTNNWYLYQNGTSGTKLTSYFPSGYFAANITDYTPVDGTTGLRYNEWNAKYQLDWAKNGLYGNQASPALDGLYIDNCFVPKVRQSKDPTLNALVNADWNRDGTSDSTAVGAPSIQWYRQGIRSLALKIKSLNPAALVTGNMGEILQHGMPSEWAGLFDGGIIEWCIGPPPICPESWYFSNSYGSSPTAFINAVQAACNAVNDERLMMVHCVPRYQWTQGASRWQYNDPYYFREMRHGLALTLVCTDAAYAFDGSMAQSATDKFPEFDFNLGQPVSGAAGAKQTAPNQNGIWRRDFDNGIVIWCPKTFTGTINLGGTFYVLRGTFTSGVNGTVIQDSTVRDSSVAGLQPGQAVTSLNFSGVMAGYTGARDGFILSRTPT